MSRAVPPASVGVSLRDKPNLQHVCQRCCAARPHAGMPMDARCKTARDEMLHPQTCSCVVAAVSITPTCWVSDVLKVVGCLHTSEE
eukprot:362948-Chlamydomonas_euryale.AAC.7